MNHRISPREYEVLEQISQGYTTDEIATKLYITAHTVVSHRKRLIEKMNARNAPGLIRRAYEEGILLISQVS